MFTIYTNQRIIVQIIEAHHHQDQAVIHNDHQWMLATLHRQIWIIHAMLHQICIMITWIQQDMDHQYNHKEEEVEIIIEEMEGIEDEEVVVLVEAIEVIEETVTMEGEEDVIWEAEEVEIEEEEGISSM